MQAITRLTLVAAAIGMMVLQGCADQSTSADVYSTSQAQHEQTVRMATVESVRLVKIKKEDGGPATATLGGSALGALLGNVIGGLDGDRRTATLSTLGGGAVGAVAGNVYQKRTSTRDGVEITIRTDGGNLRAITQDRTNEIFKAGDRVRLVSSGGITRVTH